MFATENLNQISEQYTSVGKLLLDAHISSYDRCMFEVLLIQSLWESDEKFTFDGKVYTKRKNESEGNDLIKSLRASLLLKILK